MTNEEFERHVSELADLIDRLPVYIQAHPHARRRAAIDAAMRALASEAYTDAMRIAVDSRPHEVVGRIEAARDALMWGTSSPLPT